MGRPLPPPLPPQIPSYQPIIVELCRMCKGSKVIERRHPNPAKAMFKLDPAKCDNCDGVGWFMCDIDLDLLEFKTTTSPVMNVSTQTSPITNVSVSSPVTLNVSGTPIQVKYETSRLLGIKDDLFIERDIVYFREVLYWLQTMNVKTVSKEAFLEAYHWSQYVMMSELIRRGCDLTYLNLQGMDLSFVDFNGADLSHVVINKNTKFPQKNMRDVKFDYVNLSGMSFKGFDFRGVDFSKAILTGCDFTDALFDEKTKFPGEGDFTGTEFVRCDLRSWAGVTKGSIFTDTDFSFSKLRIGTLNNGFTDGFTVPLIMSGVSFLGVDGMIVINHQQPTVFENCNISNYGKTLFIRRYGHDDSATWAHIVLEGKTVMWNAEWNLKINCDLRNCDVKGSSFFMESSTPQTKLPLNLTGCHFSLNNYFSLGGDTSYIFEKCVFTGQCLNEILRCSDRFAGSVFDNVHFNRDWVHDGRKRDFRNVSFKRSFGCYTQTKDMFKDCDLSGASFKEVTSMFNPSYKKDWTNVNLSEVDFSNRQLQGEDFSKSIGVPKTFENAYLKNAVFNVETGKMHSKSLKNCNFTKANLEGVKMINCDLTGCDFTDCNMKDANFSYSMLKNVKYLDRTIAMRVAKLSAVNFECCICFEDGDIVKLAPCNHSECCITCVLKLMSGKENQCPICRGEVTGWNKL
jgi:uncharacterized protein YjbI with pentapeptide repeats